jgi:hypothetical protein
MTDMTCANTIFQQLGGNKFAVMTGAKNLTGTDKTLSFSIMRNAKKVTHVKITLNWKDLYDIEFVRVHKLKINPVSECKDVYFDELQRVFTKETGLDTRMPIIRG